MTGRRQPGGVQDSLRDIEIESFACNAKHANRADLHGPVHARAAAAVVADATDDTGGPHAVVADALVQPAAARVVEEEIIGIGRIGIGAITVTVDRVEGAARANRLLRRIHAVARDEIVSVVGEIRRQLGMVEANALIDRCDDDRRAPGGDRPCPRDVDHVVIPVLQPVVRVVRETHCRRGAARDRL